MTRSRILCTLGMFFILALASAGAQVGTKRFWAFTTPALVTAASVRVSLRPCSGKVSRLWSRPSWCRIVACRSGTLTRFSTER